MSKYHKYIFGLNKREFIGKFEEMYKNESKEIFDSWHQEDNRQLQRKVDLAIINGYNFTSILDLGCGKGAFTHLFKKMNNRVVGIDVSKTALAMARERYPDIEFHHLDIKKIENLKKILSRFFSRGVDLVLASEILSYLKGWKRVLKLLSSHAKFLLISLDIPKNPIGFVKSEIELVEECKKYFEIIEWISIRKAGFTIIFGKSKNLKS